MGCRAKSTKMGKRLLFELASSLLEAITQVELGNKRFVMRLMETS